MLLVLSGLTIISIALNCLMTFTLWLIATISTLMKSTATELEQKKKFTKPQWHMLTNDWVWFPENSVGTHNGAP